MEAIMDTIWFKIVELIMLFKTGLDGVFGPLNFLGAAGAIFAVALLTAAITKLLSKVITTKRYQALRKEFNYWHGLRQKALNCGDPEKARRLARNIDQAKLNRVYYDYFFEGLMLNLVRKYLPIFSMLAYVNETYQAQNLLALFGRPYVFRFGTGDDPLVVGAVFWFVVALVLVYLGLYLAGKTTRRLRASLRQSSLSTTSTVGLP